MSEQENELKKKDSLLTRNELVIQSMRALLLLSMSDCNIKVILSEQGINNVAVYGMGIVGVSFCDVMEKAGIHIDYCVDMNEEINVNNKDVRHRIDEITNDVDLMVVSSEYYYHEIYIEVSAFFNKPIVRIGEFINELLLMNHY